MAFSVLLSNSMAFQGRQLEANFCIEIGLSNSTRWLAAIVGSVMAPGVP